MINTYSVLDEINKIYPEEEVRFLSRAYQFAKEAHKNQKRASGEDYFTHPCAVAQILIGLKMDFRTIAAAFLHDVLEDTPVSASDIEKEFDGEVLALVEGVTKLDKIEFKSHEEEQAENFKKIFVSMAKDIRVIIIKLADRLHNMRSLNFLSHERQLRMANETLEIFAPLARRLGISKLNCELEDLCLKYIDPEAFEYLAENIHNKLEEREAFVKKMVEELRGIVFESNIKGEVFGRPKHFYSIYKKMKAKNLSLDQIYDLTALRVLVNSVDECYELLGKIHKNYTPMPGRIKDYIAIPKENMYQSLHTTVVTPFGKVFEIQIRTYEMNNTAEYGIAAHWQYKENKSSSDNFDKRLSWIREVMEWQGGLKDSKDFLESIKGDIYNTELLVFTPKGEVISLVKDSTPVDFAYRIHTQVGNRCVGARINGKMVPLTTVLQVGDVVEIITSNTSNGPSWDWLKFVKTNGARSKIKAFYKKEKADDMIKLGKQMLESEAKNKGYNFGELLTKENFVKLCEKFSFSGQEEMYIAVGSGALNVNQILVKLIDYYKKEHRPKVTHYPTGITSKIVHSTGDVTIKGVDGLLVRFARCCNPVPGDKIIGFVSRGRGVVVHRHDCPNMKAEDPARFLDAEWTGKVGDDGYNVSLRITAKEDASVLSLVSNACAKYNMFILAINGRVDNKKHVAVVDITLKINKKEDLDNFLKHVSSDSSVIDVFRNNN
ncbi:MAG: bifunctional (p)ppGpp synthetase/guanosine-3',5'-bis(diphosphate) 3'-pyrophosphohydrolase [Clostridia bacterium]|nr:bifunctional (p)ppGpp synthetase/guanosine-3',5'-bis(diphosphate) 3'-pyrophosphohydrolase [Clostridia bacterium]